MTRFNREQLAALPEIRRFGLGAVSVPSVAPAAYHPRTARRIRRGPGTRERRGTRYTTRHDDSKPHEARRVGKPRAVEAWSDP